MTDPSGLRVIEALCPAVSRYALACPRPTWPNLVLAEPPNEWLYVESYGLSKLSMTAWNPHLFWETLSEADKRPKEIPLPRLFREALVNKTERW